MQRNWSLSGHYIVVVETNVTLSSNKGKPINSGSGDVLSQHSKHHTTANNDLNDSAQTDQTLSLPHSVCRISVAKHHKWEH